MSDRTLSFFYSVLLHLILLLFLFLGSIGVSLSLTEIQELDVNEIIQKIIQPDDKLALNNTLKVQHQPLPFKKDQGCYWLIWKKQKKLCWRNNVN